MNLVSEAIVQAIDNLEHASTAAQLWSAMKTTAKCFGYEWSLILKWPAPPNGARAQVVLRDEALSVFADALSRDETARAHPLVARAFDEAGPLSTREIFETLDGLIVPIKSNGVEGVIVMLGQKADTSPLARSAMHLLAYWAFERALVIDGRPRSREPALSPREAECLRWAAAGKTDAEIGVILSISARTTRFHIENAKKKLGVATRIQAVAEALRLKAIAA